MKITNRTSRTAGQLEKMFRELNADSFGGEIEEPIITIQDTKSAYGHVTVNKTWNKDKLGETYRHELNINGYYLYRPIEEVTATLIHEMVHLYNLQKGIQDCSRGNTYHNTKFRDEAEKHMLKIEKDEKYGWTITRPTEELLDYIIGKGWEDIRMTKNPLYDLLDGSDGEKPTGKTPTEKKPKTTSSSRRYVCPGCGAIVRATKAVNIICGDCNQPFEEKAKN